MVTAIRSAGIVDRALDHIHDAAELPDQAGGDGVEDLFAGLEVVVEGTRRDVASAAAAISAIVAASTPVPAMTCLAAWSRRSRVFSRLRR